MGAHASATLQHASKISKPVGISDLIFLLEAADFVSSLRSPWSQDADVCLLQYGIEGLKEAALCAFSFPGETRDYQPSIRLLFHKTISGEHVFVNKISSWLYENNYQYSDVSAGRS